MQEVTHVKLIKKLPHDLILFFFVTEHQRKNVLFVFCCCCFLLMSSFPRCLRAGDAAGRRGAEAGTGDDVTTSLGLWVRFSSPVLSLLRGLGAR